MTADDAERARLSRSQRAALQYVDGVVQRQQAGARELLQRVLSSAGCSERTYAEAMDTLRQHARVVLHFHPDRFGVKPIPVAEALLREGRYRNQFETGLSNGSRTAFRGGERDKWERDLFGGTYHTADVTSEERPKYGALELIRHPDGPWPRFGSCYFVLRGAVSQRTSFTFSGSEQAAAPERLGMIDRMECVIAPLLAEIAGGKGAAVPWPPFAAPTLGVENLTVAGLLEYVSRELPLPRANPSPYPAGRTLDTGVEAQVHGPIDLRHDVELLVADPAFQRTPTGDALEKLSRTYAIPLAWHGGFRLPVRQVPVEFRGPAIPRLARRIAGDGMIDAAVIGAAAASLHSQPETWRDWGSHEDALQHLKQLWHVLVHYGVPAR